jgi:hypothetical protein
MLIGRLQKHFAIAEAHVALGEECVLCQREIVRELESGGHDASQAREMLSQYEIMQAMRLLDRERLRCELLRAGFAP